MNSTYYIYDLFIDRDMDIQFLSVFAFICWWLKSQKILLVIDFTCLILITLTANQHGPTYCFSTRKNIFRVFHKT